MTSRFAQVPSARIAPRIAIARTAAALATLPAAVDLRPWAVPPGDQGSLAAKRPNISSLRENLC